MTGGKPSYYPDVILKGDDQGGAEHDGRLPLCVYGKEGKKMLFLPVGSHWYVCM